MRGAGRRVKPRFVDPGHGRGYSRRPWRTSSSPFPSSTVILLREESGGDGPFSVLMLERHGSVTFPGVHAFPGGVVDPGDHAVPGAALPSDQTWAAPGEGDRPPDALPYWVAAVRELFEEVGILLARCGRPGVGGFAPAGVDRPARARARRRVRSVRSSRRTDCGLRRTRSTPSPAGSRRGRTRADSTPVSSSAACHAVRKRAPTARRP